MRVNIDRYGPIVLQVGSRRHLKLHRQPVRRLLREGATAFPQMSPTQLNKIKIASISRYDSPTSGLRGDQVDGRPIVYGVAVKERLKIEHEAA
jgi:hypothetical protein